MAGVGRIGLVICPDFYFMGLAATSPFAVANKYSGEPAYEVRVLSEAGGQDPFDLRMALLGGSPRHRTLLTTVAEMSGGWRRAPTRAKAGCARGLAMASPFGSETATVAEVSVEGGEARWREGRNRDSGASGP